MLLDSCCWQACHVCAKDGRVEVAECDYPGQPLVPLGEQGRARRSVKGGENVGGTLRIGGYEVGRRGGGGGGGGG